MDIQNANRPCVMGITHTVAAGHYMSAQAGLQMLEAGGNAIDAGVAAGIATGVLEGIHVSIGGVAPILIWLAERREAVTISGLGCWPKKASAEYFQKHHGGKIPVGVERTVIPAAPDAWITALEKYGTMSFPPAPRPRGPNPAGRETTAPRARSRLACRAAAAGTVSWHRSAGGYVRSRTATI